MSLIPSMHWGRKAALDLSSIKSDTQDQPCKLISLPVEIQDQIYNHLFTRWSLAILRHNDELDQVPLDDTFSTLRRVGNKLVAGPPGCDILLVCRTTYNIAHQRYGQSCTGTLLLGKVKGTLRRTLPPYLKSHPVFTRFYVQIRRLYVSFALSSSRFGLNFRTLFPNMRYVDCVVHEGSYGPMVRLQGTTESFLNGQHAKELCDWTKPIVNHFLSSESRWIVAVHDTSSPWNDPHAVVNVKVLGSVVKERGTALGYNYRWEGPRLSMVSLVVLNGFDLRFWEAGMDRREHMIVDISKDDHVVPQKFRWAQVTKW